MIRLAVSADQPEIYSLICALEETSFPQEMFAWGFYTMLSSASHLLLVAEEEGQSLRIGGFAACGRRR